MRFLAIDFGDMRTGLAVGDEATAIATPLQVIQTGSVLEMYRAIEKAVAEHEPHALVVGLPLNMDGSEGPRCRTVRTLARQVEQRIKLPVHLFDERLSSYEADQQMARTGLTHKRKKQRRDALAAAAVLRGFLASRKG